MRINKATRSIVFAMGMFLFLLTVGAAIPQNIQSQNQNLVVTLVEGNWVVRLNIETGEEEKLYHSDKWWTHSISVSPNSRYIAFIEETKPECNRDGVYVVAPQRNLVILDGSGKVVNRLDDKDVKKYVWSPDAEKIAFVSFKPCDCDYKYKCPSGAWVFDLNTLELTNIRDRATEINWTVFDSAVYLYDGAVVIRNPVTQKIEATEYKDIYFSPDGKYYLKLWKDEGRPIQLYETSTNGRLFDIKVYQRLLPSGETAESFPKDIGDLWSSHDLRFPHGWVFNSGHFLLFTKSDVITETKGEGPVKVVKSRKVRSVKNFIYDPEQKEVVKEFEGAISSWVGDGSRIIVERDGKFVVLTYEDVYGE